ncbi:MAG: iron-sulfur cluster insertion protein ErpA [Gammaproteobacteria bacterium]|nr:iron-sulfur cluster insertion protein ErpA [Gammaproteobacteria bacterium]
MVQQHQPTVQSSTPPAVHLTVAAADKVATLIAEEANPKLNLRVYITGGGCSGYQYGFTFDETIQEDDTIIKQDTTNSETTIKLLVDCISVQLLQGAEIDYTSGIQEQFIIRNPNAKTTCGCGSSFSVDDD